MPYLFNRSTTRVTSANFLLSARVILSVVMLHRFPFRKGIVPVCKGMALIILLSLAQLSSQCLYPWGSLISSSTTGAPSYHPLIICATDFTMLLPLGIPRCGEWSVCRPLIWWSTLTPMMAATPGSASPFRCALFNEH